MNAVLDSNFEKLPSTVLCSMVFATTSIRHYLTCSFVTGHVYCKGTQRIVYLKTTVSFVTDLWRRTVQSVLLRICRALEMEGERISRF